MCFNDHDCFSLSICSVYNRNRRYVLSNSFLASINQMLCVMHKNHCAINALVTSVVISLVYRYPMTIRLTEKVFTEKYKDSESAEFQELSNELINSVSDCLMPHMYEI